MALELKTKSFKFKNIIKMKIRFLDFLKDENQETVGNLLLSL